MSTVTEGPQRPQLTLATKLFYGVGSVAYGVKDQGLTTLLLLFYNQVVGLPSAWVAAALGGALALDAVFDPIIGQISDNTRSRWGRRHPFLYGSIIPVCIGYLLLWNPPMGWSHGALAVWLVACVLLVRTCITVFEIPSSAMVSEFTEDYDKRTSLLSFRYFFGWAAGGVAMTYLTYSVFLAPSEANPAGLLGRPGYLTYSIFAASLMGLAILASAIGTHRWIPWLPQPKARERISLPAILKEMTTTLRHRSFLIIVASGLFSSMAMGLASALSVYIGAYFWEFTTDQLAGLILASGAAIITAVITAPMVGRWLGKKHGVMAASMTSLIVGPLPMILRLLGAMPANGTPQLIGVIALTTYISTTAFIVSSILGSSMIADVVEDSELRTGRRSEGLFFSAASLIQKAVSGLGIGLSGLVLALAQFPAKATPGQVEPEVLTRLGLLYIPFLIGLNLIALAVVSLYRIDRASHEATLRQLAEMEAAGGSESAPEPLRLGG